MRRIAPRACAAMAAALLTGCMDGERRATTSASAGEVDRTTPSAAATSTPSGAPARAADGTAMPGMVRTSSLPDIGRYITDASGRSLYMFERDSRYMSTCTDACAAAWPPFAGTAWRRDTAVRPAMLRTIERSDRRPQSSYYGMPVYYYEDDKQPGDIEGQGKVEFGGRWYLVSPRGRSIKTSTTTHR